MLQEFLKQAAYRRRIAALEGEVTDKTRAIVKAAILEELTEVVTEVHNRGDLIALQLPIHIYDAAKDVLHESSRLPIDATDVNYMTWDTTLVDKLRELITTTREQLASFDARPDPSDRFASASNGA